MKMKKGKVTVNMFWKWAMFFVTALVLLAGCRSADAPPVHVKQDMDFSYVKRIAVLPFKNLSSYPNADEIIRSYVSSELLASGFVDLVVPGEAYVAMGQLQIKNIAGLSNSQIQELGKKMNVQAVVFGSIESWQEVSYGSVTRPEITLTIIMADAASGNIIWSVTWREGGGNFFSRQLGYHSDTMTKVALRAVRNAIRTLSTQ